MSFIRAAVAGYGCWDGSWDGDVARLGWRNHAPRCQLRPQADRRWTRRAGIRCEGKRDASRFVAGNDHHRRPLHYPRRIGDSLSAAHRCLVGPAASRSRTMAGQCSGSNILGAYRRWGSNNFVKDIQRRYHLRLICDAWCFPGDVQAEGGLGLDECLRVREDEESADRSTSGWQRVLGRLGGSGVQDKRGDAGFGGGSS